MSECHAPATATIEPPRPQPDGRSSRFVALVGPPNSGKSTLFNRLTGMRQKVANYPGVTVEKHLGKAALPGGREVTVLDLPGVYSLNPRSEDERITHDVLKGELTDVPRPEAVILVLDATNLARHLTGAAGVLSLGLPTLVVLNMADELHGRGGQIDAEALSRKIGATAVLVSARHGQGIEQVTRFLEGAVPPPPRVELPVINNLSHCRRWAGEAGEHAGYLAPAPPEVTRKLDGVFLHPVAGPLIFGAVLVAVFQSIFTLAQPLMEAVEGAIASVGMWVEAVLPDSLLRSLLTDGILSGVGAVVVFLPQILILFLFIGVLEDSGYLARAALIADRTMNKVGLHGKSFIPLLSAYACAVPAIMAARTIESKRDRMATILIAPFMTCSARLPVYVLLIAAFIPEQRILGPFLGLRAATMLGLYALGFAAAVGTSCMLKSSVLKGDRLPFTLELPPYRAPSLQSIGLRLYDRSKIFLYRAGTVILATTVVLWLFASIPFIDGEPPPIEESFAAQLGRFIEPVIEPLGFDWKIGLGLISALAAREVIVGTLGAIYGISGEDPSLGLQAALQQDLNLAGALSLLVFFAFAMQCMSTVAVVRREMGGWKWALLQWGYMTGLAYVSSLVVYQAMT